MVWEYSCRINCIWDCIDKSFLLCFYALSSFLKNAHYLTGSHVTIRTGWSSRNRNRGAPESGKSGRRRPLVTIETIDSSRRSRDVVDTLARWRHYAVCGRSLALHTLSGMLIGGDLLLLFKILKERVDFFSAIPFLKGVFSSDQWKAHVMVNIGSKLVA